MCVMSGSCRICGECVCACVGRGVPKEHVCTCVCVCTDVCVLISRKQFSYEKKKTLTGVIFQQDSEMGF